MTVKWPAVGEVATGLHTGDSYEEYSIRKKGYKHTITNNWANSDMDLHLIKGISGSAHSISITQPTCPTSNLSNIQPLQRPAFPSPNPSFIQPFLHPTFPTSIQSVCNTLAQPLSHATYPWHNLLYCIPHVTISLNATSPWCKLPLSYLFFMQPSAHATSPSSNIPLTQPLNHATYF